MLIRFEYDKTLDPVVGLLVDRKTNSLQVYISENGCGGDVYAHDIKKCEIIDNKIPDDWVMVCDELRGSYLLTFTAWAYDLGTPGKAGFYENLINGEKKEVDIMRQYLVKMHREYSTYDNLLPLDFPFTLIEQ